MKTKLILLRGNSGSGKSTVAHELRMRMGYGTAVVEQDYIRRKLLREQDKPGQPNIELIAVNARFALEHGYDVIVEGILPSKKYGTMLKELLAGHTGNSFVYYFDISFEEALRRHHTRAQAEEFGEAEMRDWFTPNDLLKLENEQIIPESSSFDETIAHILKDVASS
jgi:adenylylsulfate kinase-like enzyme